MDISTDVEPKKPSRDDSNPVGENDPVFNWDADLLVFTWANKEKFLEFADNAAEELHQMASAGSPLWQHDDLGVEQLDREVYKNRFGPNIARRQDLSVEILSHALDFPPENPLPPWTLEASRATETVLMNPVELVNMFMDVEQWSATFSNIVSSANHLGKLLEDGNFDGSLIAMMAEFGLPTPIPTNRETYLLRRSRKVNDRIWLIVDASLDIPCSKYYRKPSGCLIEQMDDGFSRITWVEHNELSNGYLHELFRKHISSGFAFCARRWILTLKHEVETQFMIKQYCINGNDSGRASLVRMGHKMRKTWSWYMNGSREKNKWKLIPNTCNSTMGNNTEAVYVRRDYFENNVTRLDGNAKILLATSLRLPFTANKVYDTLRCAECRPKWDSIASVGKCSRKELHVPMGNDPSTGVSVLNIEIPGMVPIKCIQASFTDSIGKYIVWAYIGVRTLEAIMEGKDCDDVKILVSGASVLRWDPKVESGAGCILTVSNEILIQDCSSLSVELVATINALMDKTISSVNALCTLLHEDEEG